MDELERKKSEILKLIDKSESSGPKIAFYSDARVASVISELYRRWESSGGRGIPLDHATKEEIDFLYDMALKYSRVSNGEAWLGFLSRESESSEGIASTGEDKSKKKSFWRRLFGL